MIDAHDTITGGRFLAQSIVPGEVFTREDLTEEHRLFGQTVAEFMRHEVVPREQQLYAQLLRDPGVKTKPVESIMQPAFPFVDITTPLDLLAGMITPENPAVLVRDFKSDKTFIITRSDIFRLLV